MMIGERLARGCLEFDRSGTVRWNDIDAAEYRLDWIPNGLISRLIPYIPGYVYIYLEFFYTGRWYSTPRCPLRPISSMPGSPGTSSSGTATGLRSLTPTVCVRLFLRSRMFSWRLCGEAISSDDICANSRGVISRVRTADVRSGLFLSFKLKIRERMQCLTNK